MVKFFHELHIVSGSGHWFWLWNFWELQTKQQWSCPETWRHRLSLEEESGVKSLEAQLSEAAPILSIGNGSVLEISSRAAVPSGVRSCWEMVVTREGEQAVLLPGRLTLGARRGLEEGHFVCLLFLPNPAFYFHSKITSPQRHSFCVLRNLKTCCKTWTY